MKKGSYKSVILFITGMLLSVGLLFAGLTLSDEEVKKINENLQSHVDSIVG